MTRTTRGSGATAREALAGALADLLDCEPDEVQVSAPGLDTLTGSLHLDLEVQPPPGADMGDAEREDAASDDDAQGGGAPAPEVDDDQDEGEELDRAAILAPPADRGGREEGGEEPASQPLTPEDLDAEAEAAADFLEGLLDALDLPGDLRMRFHDDHVEIEIVDVGSGVLIGRRGQALEAIQEILRCALQRQFQRRARVKVDVEGYRARRLEKLIEKTEEAIDAVADTGRPERLEPMDVFERKAVHHLVAQVEGLTSRSQGREPARRVIIERE